MKNLNWQPEPEIKILKEENQMKSTEKSLIIPKGYKSKLGLIQTEIAIKNTSSAGNIC